MCKGFIQNWELIIQELNEGRHINTNDQMITSGNLIACEASIKI